MTICGRSERGARGPDRDADGLLLEALFVGSDDGVDLSLMSFPSWPPQLGAWQE
jgi:hypothetical protein